MSDKRYLSDLKFKSIDELKPHYDSLQLTGFNPRDLMKKLNMIFENAGEKLKIGDIENAYITIMKYLNVFAFIQKTDDYKKDPKYYKMMLGKQPKEAVDMAERLHAKLVECYNLLSAKKKIKEITRDKITTGELPDMRVKKESKSTVTSAKLFNMLRDGITKVLILDARPKLDFENSRIMDGIVNIPPDIIEKGKSAHMIEQALSEESRMLWKNRGTYDHVVMLDWMTNEQNFARSKLAILKEILTQWDINTVYKNEILILDGGYDDWLNSYPWNTTNPKPSRPAVEEVTSDIILDQIVYPELDDVNVNKVVQQGFLKPFFDRSKKPMKRTLNDGDETVKNQVPERDTDHIVQPNFDRAKKAAAIRTYEERKADMENLLSQKEMETSHAINLEKSMIDSERELQEMIRKQKETSTDAETKRFLEEQEEKLLLKVEELREESILKDNKIKELQKIIEIYERKDAEEIAKKQVDVERQIREAEINLRIRIQEEERSRLLKEREEMEKMREKKFQEKLELARRKKMENEHANKVPIVNRANKPRIEEKVRQFSGVKGNVGRGLTGLKNLGNTCYMNSIIQCISNNSALAKYFCGNHYLDDFNRSSKTKGEVATELAAVIKTLWSGRFKSIACRDFKNAIGSFKPEYAGFEQQDSHEFLTFLMDWLHGDLNKVIFISERTEMANINETNYLVARLNYLLIQDIVNDLSKSVKLFHYQETVINGKELSEAEKAWQDFKHKNESLISTLFYGLQRSTLSCLECNESSVTYEPFSNLSLIIPDLDTCSVEQCLKLYMKSERISGWKCPKCQEFREAEKKTDIYKLPPILVVHLKRFHYIEVLSRKRTTFVDFPLNNLNMSAYAVGNKQKNMNYSLYAVSNHYGTMEGGHYTAYCKSALYRKWYKFDDHEVVEISPTEVKTSAAYILFYSSIFYEVPDVTS